MLFYTDEATTAGGSSKHSEGSGSRVRGKGITACLIDLSQANKAAVAVVTPKVTTTTTTPAAAKGGKKAAPVTAPTTASKKAKAPTKTPVRKPPARKSARGGKKAPVNMDESSDEDEPAEAAFLGKKKPSTSDTKKTTAKPTTSTATSTSTKLTKEALKSRRDEHSAAKPLLLTEALGSRGGGSVKEDDARSVGSAVSHQYGSAHGSRRSTYGKPLDELWPIEKTATVPTVTKPVASPATKKPVLINLDPNSDDERSVASSQRDADYAPLSKAPKKHGATVAAKKTTRKEPVKKPAANKGKTPVAPKGRASSIGALKLQVTNPFDHIINIDEPPVADTGRARMRASTGNIVPSPRVADKPAVIAVGDAKKGGVKAGRVPDWENDAEKDKENLSMPSHRRGALSRSSSISVSSSSRRALTPILEEAADRAALDDSIDQQHEEEVKRSASKILFPANAADEAPYEQEDQFAHMDAGMDMGMAFDYDQPMDDEEPDRKAESAHDVIKEKSPVAAIVVAKVSELVEKTVKSAGKKKSPPKKAVPAAVPPPVQLEEAKAPEETTATRPKRLSLHSALTSAPADTPSKTLIKSAEKEVTKSTGAATSALEQFREAVSGGKKAAQPTGPTAVTEDEKENATAVSKDRKSTLSERHLSSLTTRTPSLPPATATLAATIPKKQGASLSELAASSRLRRSTDIELQSPEQQEHSEQEERSQSHRSIYNSDSDSSGASPASSKHVRNIPSTNPPFTVYRSDSDDSSSSHVFTL